MTTSDNLQSPAIPYESNAFAPKLPLWQRINWRIVVFSAIVILIPGTVFYLWADEVITGGIHDMGKYKQVDLKAMSLFNMDQVTATMDDIPPQWRQLEGQEVMMVGDMWAPKSAGDEKLSGFQLVYSRTKCCFNGPPLAQHFVDGNVVQGAKVYYYDTQVKVYGKLHVSIRKDENSIIKSIYHVDVDKVVPYE